MAGVPFLLLIEDDDAIRTALELSLSRQGHRVVTAATGEDGLKLLREQRPDLIVLDVMLPGIDGFEVCRRIRRTDQLPIILLTARNDDIDVVVGLESGADDYVVKPVQGRVLDARIRAVLRRGERESSDSATFGSLVIDRSAMTVTKNGEDLQLTPTELRLLLELSRRPGQALSRQQLLRLVWEHDYLGDSRLVDACAAAAGEGGGRTVLADPDPYGPWRRLPAGFAAVRERSAGGDATDDGVGGEAGKAAGAAAGPRMRRVLRGLRRASGLLRWTSLRLRLVVVFALVALTAAVSASGIAYWLNRNTVLERTQNAVLNDFRKSLEDSTRSLPLHPRCAELQDAARQMAAGPQNYAVLLIGVDREGKDCAATTNKNLLTLDSVPRRCVPR